jgi:hypothetical protein
MVAATKLSTVAPIDPTGAREKDGVGQEPKGEEAAVGLLHPSAIVASRIAIANRVAGRR